MRMSQNHFLAYSLALENSEVILSEKLSEQLDVIDINKDGDLSMSEIKAANYSSLVLNSNYRNRVIESFESRMGRPSELLPSLDKKVLFLHGTLDNQAPIYATKAIDLVNKLVWKKNNFRFIYFEGRGHALDLRKSYEDVNYSKLDLESLGEIISEIGDFFKTRD
jgi:pimeloyl-ACP methyl ester carboxylesterase